MYDLLIAWAFEGDYRRNLEPMLALDTTRKAVFPVDLARIRQYRAILEKHHPRFTKEPFAYWNDVDFDRKIDVPVFTQYLPNYAEYEKRMVTNWLEAAELWKLHNA